MTQLECPKCEFIGKNNQSIGNHLGRSHENKKIKPIEIYLTRFLQRIQIDEKGCWVWAHSKSGSGYGEFCVNNKVYSTHCFIYEYYHGSINPNLEIDHLCRNQLCVNPLHLEQVTHQQNVLRGISPAARGAKKTHCPQGHEYTPENTCVSSGRHCLTCARVSCHNYYQKRKMK